MTAPTEPPVSRHQAQKPRVALVYPTIPHYRRAVFETLVRSARFSYEFHADLGRELDGVATARFTSGLELTQARVTRLLGPFYWQHGLIRLARRNDVTGIIFLSNVTCVSLWIAAPIARLRRKRVLFWTHGWLGNEGRIGNMVRALLHRVAHALLLYGERARDLAVAKGFRRDSLYVIWNSLDYDRQVEARTKVSAQELEKARRRLFPSTPDRPVVIVSARLLPTRRIDLLLRALEMLRNDGHTLNLLIVGDGPLRTNIETTAREAGIPTALCGAVYDEDELALLFMMAAVAVQPGSIGLTAIHAMAYGTPVITHDNLSSQKPEAEIIDPGVNGDLFVEGDAADLAQKIRARTEFLRPNDSVEAACIRAVEERFTPQTQVALIEAALISVLG